MAEAKSEVLYKLTDRNLRGMGGYQYAEHTIHAHAGLLQLGLAGLHCCTSAHACFAHAAHLEPPLRLLEVADAGGGRVSDGVLVALERLTVRREVKDAAERDALTSAVVRKRARTERYVNGVRHCDGAPAVVWDDGAQQWWLRGKLHRVGGPAVEWADGARQWWQDDELHRTDGPAVEHPDGRREWWERGKFLRAEAAVAAVAAAAVAAAAAVSPSGKAGGAESSAF